MQKGVAGQSTERRGDPADEHRFLRLPLRLTDFSRRGFQLGHPVSRQALETHARSFVTGFNVAVKRWRDPHAVLAEIPSHERGFAYEGAGMHAALRDLSTCGRSGALSTLLAGPGERYVHLVHVGYGWALAAARLPLPVPIPSTPLLRWLALDGAGFAETYFGGRTRLYRLCRRRQTQRWQARIPGCGRALWFVESADVSGVASTIERAVDNARPHLWSGVGLAACYAGCADEAEIDDLVEASGSHWPHFGQGALFAIAARCRAGIVPAYTERACHQLFGVDSHEAAKWTDDAAQGLTRSSDISAYIEWRSRLRNRLAHQV